jgi:hypothetical protein
LKPTQVMNAASATSPKRTATTRFPDLVLVTTDVF